MRNLNSLLHLVKHPKCYCFSPTLSLGVGPLLCTDLEYAQAVDKTELLTSISTPSSNLEQLRGVPGGAAGTVSIAVDASR